MKHLIIILILTFFTNNALSQKIDCSICKGKGKWTEQTRDWIECSNCKNWAQSYKNKVPCNVCKDTRGHYTKYYNFTKICKWCKGKGGGTAEELKEWDSEENAKTVLSLYRNLYN